MLPGHRTSRVHWLDHREPRSGNFDPHPWLCPTGPVAARHLDGGYQPVSDEGASQPSPEFRRRELPGPGPFLDQPLPGLAGLVGQPRLVGRRFPAVQPGLRPCAGRAGRQPQPALTGWGQPTLPTHVDDAAQAAAPVSVAFWKSAEVRVNPARRCCVPLKLAPHRTIGLELRLWTGSTPGSEKIH